MVFYYFVQIFHIASYIFVSRLMHWQFIGNFLPKWAVSDTIKNPRNNTVPKQTLLSATSGQDRPGRNIWSECVPARRWDKELFNNKMSFFFDFCFVAFLLWLVIFVASLFLLDGDWSLMFYAKFGKQIRKFALLVYIFLSVDSQSCLLFWSEFGIPTESSKEFCCRLVHWQGSDQERLHTDQEWNYTHYILRATNFWTSQIFEKIKQLD